MKLQPRLRKKCITISVQVEVRDNVSKGLHDALASEVARRVRRTHVGGVFADDVANGHLVLDHLVVTLRISDGTEILVGPGVTGDLVAFGNHSFDDSRPLLVNGALAKVVTGDEEGSLEAGGLELVEDFVSVDVWAIVVSDGHGSRLQAFVDALSAVGNISLLGARVVASASSRRCLVGIASRTEGKLTIRSGAVVLGGTAVSLYSGQWMLSQCGIGSRRTAPEQQKPAAQAALPKLGPQRPFWPP